MKEDLYDDLYLEEKEEKTDFKAVLFKYTIHWPWFVACILLCMAGAWLYLRYTPPVYNISASVIIKDNDKNSKASSGMADLEDLGFYSSINNFDNEVEILQSRTLIKKVVEELDLYISYAAKSSFHDIELYLNFVLLVNKKSHNECKVQILTECTNKSLKKNEVPTKREHYNYLISEYSKIPPNNHSLSGTNYTHSTAFQMTITQNITTVTSTIPKVVANIAPMFQSAIGLPIRPH